MNAVACYKLRNTFVTVIRGLQYFHPFSRWFPLSLDGGTHGFLALWFSNGVTTVFEHELGLPVSRRLLSSSCASSGSHHALINPASLPNSARTIRYSPSVASKALKLLRFSGCSLYYFILQHNSVRSCGLVAPLCCLWLKVCWLDFSALKCSPALLSDRYYPSGLYGSLIITVFLIDALCCACILNISIS